MPFRKRKGEDDDWYFPNFFDDFEEEFQRLGERFNKIWEELTRRDITPEKSFVYGFTFKVGPDGKPEFQEFGNVPKRFGPRVLEEYREPITELNSDEKHIYVTIELPGIDKNQIDLQVSPESLILNVNAPNRKYHKTLKFPTRVKPETSKASYKNGILDITLERESAAGIYGRKISID